MKFLVLNIICLLLLSCTKNTIIEEEKKINNATWTYQDTLQWNFEITDTSSAYTIQLDVAHAKEINFPNVYCKFYTKYPNGNRTTSLVSLELLKSSGKPYGTCNSNCICPIILLPKVKFKELGKYELVIEQFTRLDTLVGISSLELGVAKLRSK